VIAFFSFSIRMNAWLWDWFLELQENALRMAMDTKSSRLMEIKKDFEISHAITCQKQRTAACETGITTSEKATTSEKQFPRHSEKKTFSPVTQPEMVCVVKTKFKLFVLFLIAIVKDQTNSVNDLQKDHIL